jgi:PHP family Zn ribbon phosphoesterase
MNRVDVLADRKPGFRPANAIPFRSLVPLNEIIAESLSTGVASKKVGIEYEKIIKKFDNEFNVLLNVPEPLLRKEVLPEIAEGIIRVREGKLSIAPGYDGVYGRVKIFSEQVSTPKPKQETLF